MLSGAAGLSEGGPPVGKLSAKSFYRNTQIMDIFRILWAKKIPVLLGGLAGAAVLFCFSRFLITPLYEASVMLYASNSSASKISTSVTQSNLNASSQLASTYSSFILQDFILNDILAETSLDMSAGELADLITVDTVNDTAIFTVSVRHEDPETAALIANAAALVVSEQLSALVGGSIKIVDNAWTPTETVYPDHVKMTVIGFLSGLALVFAFFLIRALSDTRIRSGADFSHWNYPLLAEISDVSEKGKADPAAAKEAWNTLRTNLAFSFPDRIKKTVVITSALPEESKSTTALNLADSLARLNGKVLLMDCDLRVPAIAGKAGFKQTPGLTDLVTGQTRDKNVLHTMDSGLHVIPAGTVPPNPVELLDSKKMELLIDQFASNYDYVLMDAPPLKDLSDSVVLSKYAGGILLVVRSHTTRKAELDAAIKKLEFAQARILGFVLISVKGAK